MKGADWRHPYGPKSNINVLDDHPVVHVSYSRCAGLRAMGGQGPADRSGMGICRARRPRRRRVRLGRRIHARRRAHGQHLAGRISAAESAATTAIERTSPVTAFPPNGYGVHDMIGNVWEWTTDWYAPKHEADAPKACCIPENPRGGREDGELRSLPAQHQNPAQGHQGRLASVRAELLPPLSAGGAPCRGGRYLDQPSRIPLREEDASRGIDLSVLIVKKERKMPDDTKKQDGYQTSSNETEDRALNRRNILLGVHRHWSRRQR